MSNAAENKMWRTAVSLGRMWGVMETLNEMGPTEPLEKNVDRLIVWAEEYVNSGKEDLVQFFQRKVKGMQKCRRQQ